MMNRNYISLAGLFLLISFINCSAKLISKTIFGERICLFGDLHRGGAQVTELAQRHAIINNLRQNATTPTMVLVEDLWEANKEHGEIIIPYTQGSIFLPGLVELVQNQNLEHVVSASIEKRFYLSSCIHFFDPIKIPPIDGLYPPEAIESNNIINHYKFTFEDLFKECESIKKIIYEKLQHYSDQPMISYVVETKLTKYQELMDKFNFWMEKNKFTVNSSILLASINLFIKNLRDKTQIPQTKSSFFCLYHIVGCLGQQEYDPAEQTLNQIEIMLQDFISRYPTSMNSEQWAESSSRILREIETVYRYNFHDIDVPDLRQEPFDLILELNFVLADTFTFLQILDCMQNYFVTVFTGHQHAQNVAEMLEEIGLTRDRLNSIPYNPTVVLDTAETLTFA